MTNRDGRTTRGAGAWVARAGWLVAGFGLAWLLLLDPLDLHSLNERSGPESGSETTELESVTKLWTCPMHPHVLEEGPGDCPVCGMDLVPTRRTAASRESRRDIVFYRHPMDPTVTSPIPMKDEMGMDYVPVYEDQAAKMAASGSTVLIDPSVVQNMNVRSASASRRSIEQNVRTVGYLEYDQERMVTLTTKYTGFVEEVYVNTIGAPVTAGQALFEVYSPELVQTEQELLSALQYARKLEDAPEEARRRAEGLVDAARTRLSFWDISDDQIEILETTGAIFRTLKVVAPASGVIMKRMQGLEGMAVRPGMELFHIADLSSLWLSVEVYEDQVAWIRRGTPAEVSFTYFPGETIRGVVELIEPELSESTRTLKVKVVVPNLNRRLKPGMFATVVFRPVVAADTLAVPTQAVLATGRRSVVVVDLGGGRFEPREVVVGREGGGFSAILGGLDEGERVVTSAQFLLDSEASLQEALQKMASGRGGVEGSPDQEPLEQRSHDQGPHDLGLHDRMDGATENGPEEAGDAG